MKLALVGISSSGRTTLFNSLTGRDAATAGYAAADAGPNLAVITVPDRRIDELVKIFKPRKRTHARVEYMDYVGLTKGDPIQNRKVYDFIKDADALVYVLRGFEDEDVTHPFGGIDPVRDFETLETELILFDLGLAEKRLQTMEESRRKGWPPKPEEEAALRKCREALEREMPLRWLELDETEMRSVRDLSFVSRMPVLAVINVSEVDVNSARSASWRDAIAERVARFTNAPAAPIILSGKIEMEIARLAPADAADFLRDLGVEIPARERMIEESYGLLGLISFLTVGVDEVRAWTIRRGCRPARRPGRYTPISSRASSGPRSSRTTTSSGREASPPRAPRGSSGSRGRRTSSATGTSSTSDSTSDSLRRIPPFFLRAAPARALTRARNPRGSAA